VQRKTHQECTCAPGPIRMRLPSETDFLSTDTRTRRPGQGSDVLSSSSCVETGKKSTHTKSKAENYTYRKAENCICIAKPRLSSFEVEYCIVFLAGSQDGS